MKVPIITANEPLQQIPVTATTKGAGRTWDAIGKLSGQVQDISLGIAERQQAIRMATELAQGEIDIEAMNEDIVNNLRKTANPDTYYQEWGKQFQEGATKRLEGVKGVRTRASMEILFSKIGARELIQQKSYANKLWVDTEKAKLGEILSNYATKDKYEEGIKLIEISKDIYSPTELLTLKNSFKATVDKTRVDLADVQADKAIMNDPKNALINLHDSSYLPNLLPKQRQDKIEKANVALKIWGNEQEKKVKEAEKLAHDTEDREIGNLFMAGKFKDAYVLAQSSKILTGDEKRTWANAIETKSKEKEEKIEPNVEAAEILMINDLISKEVDPNVIKNSIIISPRLSGANKEQYLLKLQTKLGQEVKDGRNLGYRDIQDIIIPKRGMLTDLLETPTETMAVKKAQMAFDDWIDTQTKAGKSPSMMEVRRKAQDLANHYQVGITEKINEMEKEAKKTAEEIKRAKQKK
jgi:hypothetical protein